MDIELEELKEKIKNFVVKNNVKKLEVYISRGITLPTEIEIEIRV